ncbi:MAG TPA: amino acid adenylation domain-containing protein, partial [Tahibacter sp.]|nr:amino acid adenylation domain-containing protein [Tahibacter sp.]
LTHAELERQSNRLAHYLVEQGIGPGQRVGLVTERAVELVVALLAFQKTGAAYVPLDPRQGRARLAEIVSDAQVAWVLASSARSAEVTLAGVDLVTLDGIADANDWLDGYPDCAPSIDIDPASAAYVIYTSGSTGKPKGVEIRHSGLMDYCAFAQHNYYAGDLAGSLVVTSAAFDLTVPSLYVPLLAGGTVELLPDDGELEALADRLASSDQNFLMRMTPGHVQALLALLPEEPLANRHVFVIGGEAFTPMLATLLQQRFPAATIYNHYGPTETVVGCALHRFDVEKDRDLAHLPIGRAMENTRLYVLDAHGQLVPNGVAGELHIGGAGVAIGYLHRPELTAEKFIADPFVDGERVYRSGDRVRWRADGELEFLGRIDDQVKLRGYRIEPGEIEARLRQLNGVTEAVVTVRDNDGQQRLVAYVAPADAPVESLRAALAASLPDYMVPGAFVALDALPRTPNGKVDKKRLPDVQASAGAGYAAPRNAVEATLCEIWAALLKLERVGIHDNFFAIGGDSILSTQVVARANQAGIRISTRLLFENQTVAQLARAAGAAPAVVAPQYAIQGDCALLPIQRRFFADAQGSVDHYNQSLLLTTPPLFDASRLGEVARALIERHDALRLRFERRDGEWHARHETLTAALVEDSVAIERLPDDPAGDAAWIAGRGQHWQRSLSIGAGRLWRLVHFDGGARAGRLLIVVHHLVVDGVSWRVLLADLERALRQTGAGAAVSLPPKTSSLQQWARALGDRAGSAALADERRWWLDRYALAVAPIEPELRADAAPCVGSTERIAITLDAAETDALLHRCAAPYRTRVNELLLAGVYLGMRRWRGVDGLRVALEGHGREPLFDELDLGETVGWFTSLYPLTLVADGDTADVIKAVKESCRAVPAHGVGYGALRHLANDAELAAAEAAHWPQLVFNYLGQFDQSVNADSLLQAAAESAGDKIDPAHVRPFLLGLGGKVAGGQLRLTLDYSPQQFDLESMARLADAIGDALREVIAHCLDDGAGAYTPSDFPLARIDQARLDAWQRSHAGISRIYPATPMQQGMLYHGRLERTAYVTQTYPVLAGELDPASFRRAWDNAVARHDIFRTAFLGDDSDLHQVVLARAALPWHEEDWRDLDAAAQADAFSRYRRADKERGFDFAAAPLMRIALFRLGERRWQLLWTHHHMLLDGWCLPLVYREVMLGYAALTAGDVVAPPPAPLYENYMAWLARQPHDAARAYWRERLGAIDAPTPLS